MYGMLSPASYSGVRVLCWEVIPGPVHCWLGQVFKACWWCICYKFLNCCKGPLEPDTTINFRAFVLESISAGAWVSMY